MRRAVTLPRRHLWAISNVSRYHRVLKRKPDVCHGQYRFGPPTHCAPRAAAKNRKMNKTTFWQFMATEFRRIDPSRCLSLEWKVYKNLRIPKPELKMARTDCETAKLLFTILATQCGGALSGTATPSSFDHWLKVLTTLHQGRELSGRDTVDGVVQDWIGGRIANLCEVCANLCTTFERSEAEKDTQESPKEPLADDPVKPINIDKMPAQPSELQAIVPGATPKRLGGRDSSEGSLSEREIKVHEIIGKEQFKVNRKNPPKPDIITPRWRG